jgi:hypothetical protein
MPLSQRRLAHQADNLYWHPHPVDIQNDPEIIAAEKTREKTIAESHRGDGGSTEDCGFSSAYVK